LVPRISVRRQVRFGIPVAIERLRGRQYRCLACNALFFELDRLDAHIRKERPGQVSESVPAFDETIPIRVFYMKDEREETGEMLRERF
jgi:hypothetical protein